MTMIQKDILKLAQWAHSNKIKFNERGNAKFCVQVQNSTAQVQNGKRAAKLPFSSV